jgi:hypothetical protein
MVAQIELYVNIKDDMDFAFRKWKRSSHIDLPSPVLRP